MRRVSSRRRTALALIGALGALYVLAAAITVL